jgi:heme-degrading monooxygenase HmoA
MIMRIWRTEIDPRRAPDYIEFARRYSLPMFRSQPGFKGVFFTARERERVVITLWEDIAAATALNTSETYGHTVAAIEAAGFLRGESTVELFELEDRFLDGEVEDSRLPSVVPGRHHCR